MKHSIMLVVLVSLAFAMDGYTRLKPLWDWPDNTMIPVENSLFRAAKYDGSRRVMTLIRSNGAVYEYYGVSRKTFYTFMRVRRKTSFYNAHIHRGYRHKCVARYVGY